MCRTRVHALILFGCLALATLAGPRQAPAQSDQWDALYDRIIRLEHEVKSIRSGGGAVAPNPAAIGGGAVEDQLRQVLGNLLRNAVTHTPPGTPVEVTAEGDRDEVQVVVRDHGPGLPTSDPDELFERFWRSEGGRTRGRAGAGLGLAIVAAIVDAHGGRVEAGDAEGGGARFVMRLPRRRG